MVEVMRTPDLDRERSEEKRSLANFLKQYNKNLPDAFPPATAALLRLFKKEHASLFQNGSEWSLDQHRKKVMDWLTSRKEPVVS